ncbi:MAG: glycosyltransferase family 2 protein [Methylotenera sp.]|nr:glycosyltransferase family 2 protein [Methylotenera sp.]
MLSFIEVIFYVAIAVLSVPVFTFCLQVCLAMLPFKHESRKATAQASVAILIPAHNESSSILPTLLSIKGQLGPNTKVLVVADNCSDDTAEIVKRQGVEVIERTHATNRGKGYALDFGIQHLTKNPPDVLIVLDADCVLEKDTISILVSDAMCHQRPIQALYLMQSQSHASLKIKIAEFAWLVKNWVRPLGLHRLGLPCQLMGSGMAFPWHVIKQVNLASGHIVEDMKLGVDLAKLNLAPRFCPEALVRSQFPTSEEGIKTQRTRWEHGHIGMIVKEGPFLIGQSIKHLNLKKLAIALDMCVPPLALLILIIVGLSGLGVTFSVFTQQLFPWLLPVVFLLLVGAAVMLAWLKFGRSILSFNTLMMAPFYVLAKIPLYVKFLYKRQSEWVRSKRDS